MKMNRLWILLSLVTISSAQLLSTVCPAGWLASGDTCFQFNIYPPMKYDEASQYCQQNGAALVSVNDMVEHGFIAAQLLNLDRLRQDWYTSGERDSSKKIPRYVWTAIDREIPMNSQFWRDITQPNNTDITRDILVYGFDPRNLQYNIITVSDRNLKRSFICEISRMEVYRINAQSRGFDYGVSSQNVNMVPRGPKFVMEASSTVVMMEKSSRSVNMECIAFSIPQAEYLWTRNTSTGLVVINSQMNSRYTISNGRLTIDYPTDTLDNGFYQCTASNVVGKIISSFAQLTFATLGQFSPVQTEGVNPKYAEGALMECPKIPSSLAGGVSYQWMKSVTQSGFLDSEYVRPELNSYIFVSSNGRLYFSEVTEADHGWYRCIATLTTSNIYMNYISTEGTQSRISQAIRLMTRGSTAGKYAPMIQDSFINVYPSSPVVGMNVSLECFAYGTPPLMYSWTVHRWDGQRYTLEDHDRVLRIQNVVQDDTGRFTCTVTNKAASQTDSKTYTLYVESKPQFVMPLMDQHLDVGTKQLTWQCEARSVPFPTYTWYKDGVRITNSTNGEVQVISNILFLRNLQEKRDSGMYQCFAENSHGTSTSAAQLRILSLAPTFEKNPMALTKAGALKGDVTIECRPEAAPTPEINWFMNGGGLNPSSNPSDPLYRNIKGDLVIRDLQQSNAGMYECRAVNSLGEAKNSTYLSIYAATVISTPPSRDTTVSLNSTAFINCQVSFNRDNLDIVYQWLFNNRTINISSDSHYEHGLPPQEGGLYIRDAQYWHGGMYTCRATTQVDATEATGRLWITGPPREVSGVDAYSSMSNVQLPMGENIGEFDALLRWTDPQEDAAPITYYNIYGRTNYSQIYRQLYSSIPASQTVITGGIDSFRRQFFMKGLMPGVNYEFTVRAVNMYGVGTESKPSRKVTIGAAPPRKAPVNVGGGGGSVGTLKITWDPLHPEDHGGWGIGYEVEYRRRPPDAQAGGNFKWTKVNVTGNVGEYSAEIGGENYFLEYQVRVSPYNNKGIGPAGVNDSVMSAEAIPNGIPKNIYAEPHNESALVVRWDPISDTREVIKGKLAGYKIHYWLKDRETQSEARQNIIYGNADHGLIIGLMPDTFYTVTVMVFNGAGNGVKGEVYHQTTDRFAPLTYPVDIKIYPYGNHSVMLTFRGVNTGVIEEPLLGYKVKYWRDSEDIRNAKEANLERNVEGVLYDVQVNTLYHCRVYGYSVGGDGKGSSPDTLFTYTEEGRVIGIQVDPTTSNFVYVVRDDINTAAMASYGATLLISIIAAAVLWLV
ncbi:contactin-5-like [Dreissena polymorpha]|uniref:contactin-5-like n=1 Tax=Dreissena polymorpha TaxID=45954 RepID=UPI0022656CA1|nr:contactin-5-like [Dreissena polymorpha]